MRLASPARCLFLFWGLGLPGSYSAEQKMAAGDGPPVLIRKDGGNVPWLDAPLVMVSREGGSPKWTNVAQLKEFAAKDDPQACFELAERFLYGDEVPPDIKQAVRLMERAGQGGINNAWFRLGKIYHDGLLGAPDYERTLDYYTRAARAGVPEAQHNLGAMLVSARGVKRDLVEGLAWLIVATKSGAVSEAEVQVRDRLARRPTELKAAAARAKELLGNLSAATVRAVLKVAPAQSSVVEPPKAPVAPVITNPMIQPVVTAPRIDPLVPVKISPPTISPPVFLPADKP